MDGRRLMLVRKMSSPLLINLNPLAYTGKWDDIHNMSLATSSREDQKSFASCLRIICYTHYCGGCRSHANAYIEARPPENSFSNCFHYTVEFHNNVNARLNKPIVDYNTAVMWYTRSNNMVPPHFNAKHIYLGKWNDIHYIAAYADLSGGLMYRDYEWFINVICRTLPNSTYVTNSMNWLRHNPPNRYFVDNNCFLHSWKFHDYINQIANKPLNKRVSYEDAKRWYQPSRTSGCIVIPDRDRPGIRIMNCEQ